MTFIAASTGSTDVGCRTVKSHISFERLHDFRDVGGHVTEDGRTVRRGQLYRSDARIPEHPPFAHHHLRDAHHHEDGVRELRRALELIASEESEPVVFHCPADEDRTELLAALVLALLGVAETDIVQDFAHARTTERYGSLRAYAAQVLGADDELVSAALRRRLLEPAAGAELAFRRGVEADIPVLVRLRDEAARWQIAQGIAQWKPGELGEEHFRARLADSELWIATLGPDGPVAGAWELWWDDPAAWGPQPPVAGYVHRLMTDRATAPAGTGRRMLAHAERRVRAAGRGLCRLDCRANNPRLRAYYASAGYEVVGEQPSKDGGVGGRFAAALLEKRVLDAVPERVAAEHARRHASRSGV
ncbi:protein tyrosine phosphatase [Streptomyces silvensis]|uniref:Protein tyrosine phosphatase n=1 Tax=Streptomyces silvensis TaxID=1765722 RepID=A0A0W7X1Y9_9ACTN|nr:protein tyrosine phosphatase [Streptomyces silvensis]